MIHIKKYENEEICNSDKITNFNSYKSTDMYGMGGEVYLNSYDAIFTKQMHVNVGPVSTFEVASRNLITHFAEKFKSFKINGVEQITTPGQSGELFLNSPTMNTVSTHITPRETYVFSDTVAIPIPTTIKKLDLSRELTEYDSIIYIYGYNCYVFCYNPEGDSFFDINNAYIHEEGTTVYEPNAEYMAATFDTYEPENIFICAVSNPNGRILSPNDIIPMSITHITEDNTEETIVVTQDALQKKIIGDVFPVDFTEDVSEVTFTFDRELTENDMVIITSALSPKFYGDPNYKEIWLYNDYRSIDGDYMFDDSFVSPYLITNPPCFERISDSTYRLDTSLFYESDIISIIGYTNGMLKDENNPFPNSIDECIGATINVSGYTLTNNEYYAEFEFTDEYITNINSSVIPTADIQSAFMNSCITEMKASGLKKLQVLEPYMFYNSRLQKIELPNTLTHIHQRAFYGSPLESITIPKNVEYIGENAFRTNTEFKYVDEFFTNNSSLDMVANDYWGANVYETLTNDGIYIRGKHVVGCIPQYENIVIPEGIEYIDSNAFYYNTVLKHITFPSTLKVIDSYAFDYCSNLQEAIIPEGVTKLYGGFRYCTSLNKIVIPSTLKEVNTNTFYGVIIESSNYTCNISWLNNKFLGAIIYDEIRDNLYINGTYAIGVVDKNITEIVVPEGITHVTQLWLGTKATKLTLPSTLTSIFAENTNYNSSSLNEIVCNATTQPQLNASYPNYIFYSVKRNGVLKVPTGSNYSTWMGTSYYYLGYMGWTIEYI